MKLFRSITLMLLFVTAAPITVVGIILIDSNVDTLKTLTWEMQQERAEHAGKIVSHYFNSIIEELDLVVSYLPQTPGNLSEMQELLSIILQRRPEINIVAFYDPNGQALPNLLAFDSNRILPSELVLHQDRIARLLADLDSGQPVFFTSPLRIERQANQAASIDLRCETVIGMSLVLERPDVAFLGIELSLEPLEKIIGQIRSGPQGHLMLMDQIGNLITAKPPNQDAKQELEGLANQVLFILKGSSFSKASDAQVSGARPVRLDPDQDVLMAYASLGTPPWWMISLEPLELAYQVTRTMAWQVFWVVLFSLVVAVALGMLFAFNITRPVAVCVKGALAIARGNFGTIVETKTRNEIGELAHTFNYMSRQLLAYDSANKDLLAALEKGYLETIQALANSIDAKDPYTRGHSVRVTNLSLAVGLELKLDEKELNILRYASILHDIGKIGIQEAILLKKGRLSPSEREIIQTHPVLGEKIIAPIDFLQPVRSLVRHHHEWFDGSGYPDGLVGEKIPLGSRIIGATDTFDAVTSKRPYQAPMDNEAALILLEELKGRQIDPKVGEALVTVIRRKIAAGHLSSKDWEADFAAPFPTY